MPESAENMAGGSMEKRESAGGVVTRKAAGLSLSSDRVTMGQGGQADS